jgi:hypothetical protein
MSGDLKKWSRSCLGLLLAILLLGCSCSFSGGRTFGIGIPAPTHPLLFGYYYADGRYGDFTSEVDSFTNLHIAGDNPGYGYAASDQDWQVPFRRSLQKASNTGKRIFLMMGMAGSDSEDQWDEILEAAKPFWDHVNLVEVGHEPGWNKQETEKKVKNLEACLAKHGLPRKPIGITNSIRPALETDAVEAQGLDWAAIEAYVDGPGNPDSKVNVDKMTQMVAKAKKRIPVDKKIVLIMQAYDRNSNWKNMKTLADLQMPTYLLAYDDPQVVALLMFSYARPGGSRDHPELKAVHEKIGKKIMKRISPKQSINE